MLPLVLVIGCGSIGERHVRTFLRTGRARVIGCDVRAETREHIARDYRIDVAADWSEAIKDPAAACAVIATPAPQHVEMAVRCLDRGLHVLIEKPLALDTAGIERLRDAARASGRFVAVAYVLHFAPGMQAARDFLHAGSFGPVRHVAVTTGQHFPLFRPAYRSIYYRDRAQGGGAIQDALTHMANAVEWVIGPTSSVFCDAAHQVLEGVEVEDTVNAIARNGDVLVSYALNQFQAPNETRLDFHAANGTVRVELDAQRWGTLARGATRWEWQAAPLAERDTMYLAQAGAFLDGGEGRPNALCTLDEGIRTLRFNVAALQSAAEQRIVTL